MTTRKQLNVELPTAAMRGNLETIKRLINLGVDLNALDIYGNTSLMWACYEGNAKIAKLLLDNGADWTVENKVGQTALLVAELNKKIEIVELIKVCIKSATEQRQLEESIKSTDDREVDGISF